VSVPRPTWVGVPPGSPFGPATLPYGVVSVGGSLPRPAVAIGASVLDLAAAADAGLLRDAAPPGCFTSGSLERFLAAGPPTWAGVRSRVGELLTDPAHRDATEPCLVPASATTAHLPFPVADYVDFYSSRHHAENVGRIFRPGEPALPPNWLHLPLGYHGRAGTVVVSGTPLVRPCGQGRPAPGGRPAFGPSTALDVEVEVGFVVGVPSANGTRVPAAALTEHVLGVVLVNDWSARDLQAWEYRPLGPFLGKSFATSVSPWVVPLEALRAARVPPVRQDPPPVDVLTDPDPWCLDLRLELEWNGVVVSRPPFASMYWTPGQQLAHLTSNGAGLRTGDLFASGTVSGPGSDERGSLLELCWNGTRPYDLGDGRPRAWLADGDTVTIRGWAGAGAERVGLGEVTGRVLPAVP
jgi:fumarylacetoacetase